MKDNKLNIKQICEEYQYTQCGIETLALKYHVGKLKIKKILSDNGIEFKKRGGQSNNEKFMVSDWRIDKYPHREGYHYIAVDRFSGFMSKDVHNNGGVLTTYIHNTYNVEIPTLYDRRMYYMRTGNYWWEQWFDINPVANMETKKCPYCDWETIDVDNKSGAFEMHLKKVHGISKKEYLTMRPEERKYFQLVNQKLNRQMETDPNKFVVCQVCGEKLARITSQHLKKHNMTKLEYISQYGTSNMTSQEYHKKQGDATKVTNMNTVVHKNSKSEKEIMGLIRAYGLECRPDRKILTGSEIDIYIPSMHIGIEYNGNIWHSEWFGKKDKNYHVDKLNRCKEKGVRLIMIFEDEYEEHKDLVQHKILHLLGKDGNKESVYGRKTTVHEIRKYEAESFLNSYHIQGFANSTIYLGGFFNGSLIAVMTFLNEGNGYWNLTRFASDFHYKYAGVGGKMFSYFTTKYSPTEIKSLSDRRWCLDMNDNLYTKLGFSLEEILKPDYRYYNSSVDRYKRFHKFLFRKQILVKKYNLNPNLTETEMARELGYDRIWDCGLIKYVWRKLKQEPTETLK